MSPAPEPVNGRRAVVVGAGPNGLVAAVTLARRGWKVEVLEAGPVPGGGTRSAELVEAGVLHDICSAIHPLALASPALRDLPLAGHGLRWVQPDAPVAHVLAPDRVVVQHRSVEQTVASLGADGTAWRRLFGPILDAGDGLTDGLLSPLKVPPRHPMLLARFGLLGIRSADSLAGRFRTPEARALLAGHAGHAILPLDAPATGAYALMLAGLAHRVGWPMAEGGSQRIADALVGLLESLGGTVTCDRRVASFDELPPHDAALFDVTPRQLVQIMGDRLPVGYRRRLARFRYGTGVFKVDWVLREPIPWRDPGAATAGTVHLGGSFERIAAAEAEVHAGRHPEHPYVLLAQHTLFDPTRVDTARAPAGRQTVWAYCHVPSGSTLDMTSRIEAVIEAAAPGFRDCVVGRHTMGTVEMEAHDANYIGGDINGGVADLRQFVARPVASLHPWRTPVPGVYLCSASTPPGGGVHGMCGRHAAREVLRDAARGRL